MTRRLVSDPRPAVPAARAVYVAALNRHATIAALGDALLREPYRTPPRAPVLHLKPANTWIGPGDPIPCPRDVPALRMGGTLGLVIGRRASRVAEGRALEYVGGWLVANDVSIPYESHYRPAIKQRCRDGFCPIGAVVDAAALTEPDRAEVVIEINGRIECRAAGSGLVRGAARLLAEVSTFITFEPGDLLLVGEPGRPPLAGPGDTVRIIIANVGTLESPIRWDHEAAR